MIALTVNPFTPRLPLAFLMAWSLSIASLSAQSAVTAAAGFNDVACLGGSDTIVTIPFHLTPVYQGKLKTKPVLSTGSAQFTVTGSPGWNNNEFIDTHYVEILNGNAAGLILPLRGNGADSVLLQSTNPALSWLREGDALRLIPHWKLSTLFPPASQRAFHPSTGMLPSARGSELLLYGLGITGSGLVPSRILFVTGTNWHDASDLSPVDDLILPPHCAFVIRHQPGTATTSYRSVAFVDNGANLISLLTNSTGPQDNVIGLMRPVPVAISDLGLLENGSFQQSLSTAPSGRRDELLVFDNSVASYDKAPSARYFAHRGRWFADLGTGSFPDADQALLTRGAVVIIRKAKAPGPARDWLNPPTYDATDTN